MHSTAFGKDITRLQMQQPTRIADDVRRSHRHAAQMYVDVK